MDPAPDLTTRVVRTFALSMGRIVAGHGVAAIAFVILARELQPHDYAIYASIAAIVPLAFYMCAQPIVAVLLQRDWVVHRGHVRSAQMLVAAPFVAVAAFVGFQDGSELERSMLVVAVIVFGAASSFAFPWYLFLARDIRTGQAELGSLAERATFQLVAAACVLLALDLRTAIAIGLTASGLVFAVVLRWLAHHVPSIDEPGPISVRHLGTHAWRPVLASALLVASETLVVPGMLLGGAELDAGLFAWSFAFVAIANGFVLMAASTLVPAFGAADERALPLAVARATRLVGVFGGLLACMAYAIVPLLVPDVFPSRWEPALDSLWVMLLGVVAYAFAAPGVAFWGSARSMRQVARWQAWILVTMLVGMIVAGVVVGAVAAAAAYAIGRAAIALRVGRGLATTGISGTTHAATVVLVPPTLVLAWLFASEHGLGDPFGYGRPFVAAALVCGLAVIIGGRPLRGDIAAVATSLGVRRVRN